MNPQSDYTYYPGRLFEAYSDMEDGISSLTSYIVFGGLYILSMFDDAKIFLSAIVYPSEFGAKHTLIDDIARAEAAFCH